MGSDAAGGGKDGASSSGSGGGGGGGNGPSAIQQAKKQRESQDDSTQDPVLLGSVRRPATGARVHALPCSIVYDGPAAVSTYFLPRRVSGAEQQQACNGDKKRPAPKEDEAAEEGAAFEAQFRGRNLKGVKVGLPAGMVGFVARETVLPPELADAAPSAAANRYWAIESEFKEAVLWRHDLAPPTDHCMQQVQEWCTLARAIHDDGADAEQQQTAE